jgi:hypothetical protein
VLVLKPNVDPSAAVEDMRQHPERYQFDCATGVRVVNLIGTKDTIGSADFNETYRGLEVYGHFDTGDGRRDGGAWIIEDKSGTRPENNEEFKPFNPATGDRLMPGDWRWYESPNDRTTAGQGWNVVYMGQDAQGRHQFWKVDGGVF